MSEVTEALLVLAREADGEPSAPAQCAADDVLAEVIEDHRHLLDGKPVAVEFDRQGRFGLPVERALLRVVLGNVVRNAFSYTELGRIRIRLGSSWVSVEDTGPGIEPGRASRLFERYYRAGSGAGAGIGLALVKRICDRYGWGVSMESDGGAGTVTRIDFGSGPTGSQELPDRGAPGHRPSPGGGFDLGVGAGARSGSGSSK
jgi:signal transduction histidine kinase